MFYKRYTWGNQDDYIQFKVFIVDDLFIIAPINSFFTQLAGKGAAPSAPNIDDKTLDDLTKERIVIIRNNSEDYRVLDNYANIFNKKELKNYIKNKRFEKKFLENT